MSSSKIRSKPVNIFIIHQSIIDTLVCIVTISVTVYHDVYAIDPGTGRLIFCCVMMPRNPMWTVIQCSGYNLMFLTLERYWAITNPLNYNPDKVVNRIPVIFAAIWIIAILVMLPNSLLCSVINDQCIPYGVVPEAWMMKALGAYLVSTSCFIPGGVMVWAYVSIGLSLKKSESFQNSETTNQSIKIKQAQSNLLQTCVLLVLLFGLCWTNHVIRFVLMTGGYFMHLRTSYYPSTALLVVLNSCFNPFIYCARYKEFQQQVKILLKLKSAESTHSDVTKTSKY